MKRTVLLLLLLGIAPNVAPAAIDPFYGNRLASGVRAFDQGDWEQAAHHLRIACFGHLDEPVALVECLMRLAVVEVRLGDDDSFRRIFTRLVELEEKFSAFSAAQASAALQQQFEGMAARLVPLQSLQTTAGFEAIAKRAQIQRLADLPPQQRRAEVERRLQTEPERADWLVEMARLELLARRPQPALDWLDQLTAAAAETPPATCLRQQAATETGSCNRMDLGSPFCQGAPASVIEFRLKCLVDEGRWPEASSLLAGLDPDLRGRRRIARLERRVREQVGDSGQAAATVASPPVTERAAAATGPATATESAAPTPLATASRQLELLHAQLAASTTGSDLTALMAEVESFADRNPSSRQARLLAAEIAYLQSDWPAAVRHFGRAGRLDASEASLAFYQAVALYETGDATGAARVLRPVAKQLQRNEFVDAYVERILAPGG